MVQPAPIDILAPHAQEMFLDQLYKMLQDVESSSLTSIVSWVGSAGHFRVLDRERFEQEVLPQYFDSTKFKSFRRQLNLYRFECVRESNHPMKGCYFHPHFRRDQPPNTDAIWNDRQLARQRRRSATRKQHEENVESSKRPEMDLLQWSPQGTYDSRRCTARRRNDEDKDLLEPLPYADPFVPHGEEPISTDPVPTFESSQNSSTGSKGDNRIFVDWLCQVPDDIQTEIVSTFSPTKR